MIQTIEVQERLQTQSFKNLPQEIQRFLITAKGKYMQLNPICPHCASMVIVHNGYYECESQVIKDLPSFKNLQKNTKLTTSQINQWTKINSNTDILKIWKWKLSVTSDDAKSQGWLGKGIGDYMRKKEEDLFLGKRSKGIGY